MTKRNRILYAALSAAIALLLLLPVFPARAAIATEGVCGDGLYFELRRDGESVDPTGALGL